MVKRRSRKIFLVILLVVIIVVAFAVFLGLQSSQGVVPGVHAGDEFVYDIMSLWSSSDPNLPLPENLLQLNMTEYKVTVTEVSDKDVSINTTWLFKNGTELKGKSTVNVETGIVYPLNGFWPIYAANLKANDLVRSLGPDRSFVNETTTNNYAGGTRETNLVSIVRQYYDSDDSTYSTTWTEYIDTYFDRQTGMLVELRDVSIYTNPKQTLIILWKIKESNVWTVS